MLRIAHSLERVAQGLGALCSLTAAACVPEPNPTLLTPRHLLHVKIGLGRISYSQFQSEPARKRTAVFWLTTVHIYCESLRTSAKSNSCEPSSVSWLRDTAEVQNVSLGDGLPRFPGEKVHCALVYPIVCTAEGVPLNAPALQLRQCYNLIYFMISILSI